MAEKPRILLVDDEPSLLQAVAKRLEGNGYAVLVATNGVEGLQRARRDKPDLIVLDVMMPKLNGFEVCRLLKFDKAFKHIPIILFTALTQDKDKRVGLECGADAYLRKSFKPQELFDQISALLKRHGRAVGGAALLLAMSATLSGCLLFPYDAQVRRLQAHADVLNQRVEQLEWTYGLSGAPAGSVILDTAAPPVVVPAATPPPLAGPTPSRWPSVSMPPREAFAKLVRGLTNILTGWVEIPKRVHETTERSGAGAGFTWGFCRGAGYGFIRTAGGVYEALTFPFPAPPDYRPVMQPSYIFQCETAEP